MKRGEIRTVAGGKDYAGKPRPVVIIQDDSFDATNSITICAFTTGRPKRRCSDCRSSQMNATVCTPLAA